MILTPENKKRFRTIGHDLKPVVIIAGNGLSENVSTELNRALDDHELIKIKVALDDRDARRAIIAEACVTCRAELVQVIGKVALLFRAAKQPKLSKSNVR